ncbi:MAG: APC family permease [Pseudomonadota bacterium]
MASDQKSTAQNATKLNRHVGLIGLCFVAVGGMMGSGWLFAPLLVAQAAGPAALVSWLIGAVMILLITLTFAEIASLLPVAGGIARIPHFSYGNVVSMAIGFAAWVGYCMNAPIAVMVTLEYASNEWDFIFVGDVSEHNLSWIGIVIAGSLMLVMVIINYFGVRIFAACNTGLTWIKILIPISISVALIASRFDVDNFTADAGFAPGGLKGIMTGIASGGVIFAFFGFRHAIDMAGETKNPKVTIPLALTLSVLICAAIYMLIQVAFIGALPNDELISGWDDLTFDHQLGPLAALATSLGLLWVSGVIYGGALIAPFGGGLVATASNARLALALSRNGFFLKFLDKISNRGVPLRALWFNYALGMAMIFTFSFEKMVSLQVAALALSFCVGPLCVYSLRSQLPHMKRGFAVPVVGITAPLAFICAVLVIYWTGWNTTFHLALTLAVGGLLFAFSQLKDGFSLQNLDLKQGIWLLVLLCGTWLLSYLGNFGGGLGVIPFGWDSLACALLALFTFYLGYAQRLPNEKASLYLAEEIAAGDESDQDF